MVLVLATRQMSKDQCTAHFGNQKSKVVNGHLISCCTGAVMFPSMNPEISHICWSNNVCVTLQATCRVLPGLFVRSVTVEMPQMLLTHQQHVSGFGQASTCHVTVR